MPVIISNTAVIQQGACKPIATPPLPIDAPVLISPLSAPDMVAPRALTAIQASFVASPLMIPAVSAAVIAAARDLAEVSAAAIAAPRAKTSVTASEIAAPIAKTSVSPAQIALPRDLTERPASLIALPRTLTSRTASTPAAPRDLVEVAASELLTPRVLTFVVSATIAAPRDLTERAASTPSAPRVLTAKTVTTAPPFPLTHPRILYQTVLGNATVLAGGTGATNVLNPNTWQQWTGVVNVGSSAVITFELPAAANMDCLCIAAHTFGSMVGESTIRCEYRPTTTGDWFDFAPLQTRGGGDNREIMFVRLDTISVRQIRVRVTSSNGAYSAGVIWAGVSLQMPHPIYGGHSPITLNRTTDYFVNRSESGAWLGRQIRRRGFESSAEFSRIRADYYRQYVDPFVSAARTSPFFFAWRPADYPAEVAYCWTDSDIGVSNTGGGNNYMSVNIPLRAYG